MSEWQLGIRMMRLSWWGLTGVLVGHVALTIYVMGADLGDMMRAARTASLVLTAAEVTFAGGLAYGALGLRSGDVLPWRLGLATFVTFALGVNVSLATLLFDLAPSLAEAFDAGDWSLVEHTRLALTIAGVTFFISFAARALARARAKLPLPLVFGIAGLYTIQCVLRLGVIEIPTAPAAIWIVRLIDVVPSALSAVFAGVVLSRLRAAAVSDANGSPYRDAAHADARDAASLCPAWIAAADGLGLYASALATRIAATVAGACLMYLAGRSRSPEAARGVAVLIGSTSALTSVAMMFGVQRYRSAPDEDAVGQGPTAALLLMALGFALELYGLKLLFDLTGGRPADVTRAVAQLPNVQLGALGVGLFAVLLLLASFARVARSFGALGLASRGGTVTVLLIAIVPLAVVLRVVLGANDSTPVFLVSVALLVGVALTAIVRYVRLAFAIRNVMRARAAQPA